MKNIILLGAPGAGKGTQAEFLQKELNIPHISTGDIFRALDKNSELGQKVDCYMKEGKLVPDEIVVEVVANRLKTEDCQNGYLLDGFPRSINQAKELDKITNIDTVINIFVPIDKLEKRLTGRRVCPSCGKSYHINSLNGSNTCTCGTSLIQRSDDNVETVANRLDVYTKQTEPLIEYYKEQNKLLTVDGEKNINEVSKDILSKI